MLDQHPHMSRQSDGLACQVDTQPIAYFLANSCTGNAVDLNIIANGWIDHEIFLVGLAAVNIPRFKGTTAAEGQLFRCCSLFSCCSCKGALLQRKRRCSSLTAPEGMHGQAIALGVTTKKAADFSAAFCR